MNYPIESKLVVAVASSALFDLSECDQVFREKGEQEYRRYQRAHEDEILAPGVAFPFVRRLLSLNVRGTDDQPVEVILLSRNDPDTGLRVFNSITHYDLRISRAAFLSGKAPHKYISAFNASLFLSGNAQDVREAVTDNEPAGQVLGSGLPEDGTDEELRIAFDFDGVLATDQAEQVYRAEGLAGFHDHEMAKALQPLEPGPLKRLLEEIARLQRIERERKQKDPGYAIRVRTAIITSRNAPAHKRVITTLRHWGITADETFFLGGMSKNRILEVFRPHIFFDDQVTHAEPAIAAAPSVHVPFGAVNRPSDTCSASESRLPTEPRGRDRAIPS